MPEVLLDLVFWAPLLHLNLDFLRDFWALSFLPPLVLQQPQLLQSVQVSLDWDWPVEKTIHTPLDVLLSNIYFSLISCPYSPLVEEDLLKNHVVTLI